MDAERRAELRKGARYGGLITQPELEWLLNAADERDRAQEAHDLAAKQRDALRAEVERLQAQRLQSVAKVRKELRYLLESDDAHEALQWVLEEVLGD